jgi:hypothetical protein
MTTSFKQEDSSSRHDDSPLQEKKNLAFIDLTGCSDDEEENGFDEVAEHSELKSLPDAAVSVQPKSLLVRSGRKEVSYRHRGHHDRIGLCTIDENKNFDASTAMPPPVPKFSSSQTNGVKRSSGQIYTREREEPRSKTMMASSLSFTKNNAVPNDQRHKTHNTSNDAFFVLDYSPRTHHGNQSSSSSSLVTMNSWSRSSKMRTSAITLFDSNHGRQRRQERVISKREIQCAIKYGKEFPHPWDPNLCIYEHNGKRHILTRKDRVLVTTMALTINLRPKFISEPERKKHYKFLNAIHGNEEKLCSDNKNDWSSHSILIVDKSGSMRNSDVAGCRTRLGAVWLSIAQDFIEYRLKAGMASSLVSF